MNTTQTFEWQTYNTTDIRFRLGKIINELERKRRPVLIISRSKPKAWLYPYEQITGNEDYFAKWQKVVFAKYKKVKAKDFIALIRQDRERAS